MTTNVLSTSHQWNSYIHQRRPIWDILAIAYTLLGYAIGVALLTAANLWLNLLGVGLVTHTLVLSAYLAHEFVHGTVFSSMRDNAIWGNVMQWLHGTNYVPFRDMMQFHIDHHIDGVDFYSFDRITFLEQLPAPVRSILVGLEWLYFPSLFFVIQLRAITAPFWSTERQAHRWRTVIVLLSRVLLFGALAWVSLKALLLYALSYLGMVNIIRIMDCLQHSYEAFPLGTEVPKKDPVYEQANTFSTPISRRLPVLNLLLLNFGYHNAHHAVMKCPWYNLPDLDRAMAEQQTVHHIGLLQVLKNYHRFRIYRLFSLDEGKAIVNATGTLNLEHYYGVIGGTSILLPG